MRIISEAPKDRTWIVYHAHSARPIRVKAPDADVALYRAKQRGVEVSGTVREARS
jgi:hypothetical protein